MLLAAIFAVLLLHSVAATSSPPPLVDIATKPHRTVCVAPYTALDNCGTDGTVDFTGYEPELFKAVAAWLYSNGSIASKPEWAPGKWSFSCFYDSTAGYYDLIAALNNGTCDVAMGGITQDEVQAQPVVLTSSTYQAGRRIIIYRPSPQAWWVFLQPFSTGVWLLMFGSSVVLALVLLAMETPWLPICRNPDGADDQSKGLDESWQQVWLKYWQRYSNLQWSVTGLLLHGVFQLSPRSPGGRVLVLGTAFTSLLLACMYTSSYAALITTNNLKAQVTSMSDLSTLPVGIWEGDDTIFKEFPLQNVHLLPWNNAEDEESMLRLLRQGTLAALVIDAPFADYRTSINCDLYEVGELVLPINMGFGMATSLSAYAINFDAALRALSGQGALQQLQIANIRIPSSCTDKQPPGSSYTQIMLHDVGGLWIILASCIGLGILWNLLTWIGPHILAWLGLGGLSPYTPHDPAAMDVLDPAWRESQGLGTNVSQPNTIDEALLGVDRRLDKLEYFMDQLPRVLSQAMDQRLTALQVELAVVIRHQLLGRGISNPGGKDIRESECVVAQGKDLKDNHSTPR